MGDDEPAWVSDYSKFFIESKPRLVAFLVCIGLSFTDADDCAQETLIEALPPTWETLESHYAWCRTVAYRKALALRRRNRETPVGEHPDTGRSVLIAPPAFDDLEHGLELVGWLGRLASTRQRQVLAWTYDGATAVEIAEVLGMDHATVRSTIRHARANLRKLRDDDADRNGRAEGGGCA